MDASTIYAKTPEGEVQLKTRSIKLPMLARSALVMVDGVKNAGDIGQRLGKPGEFGELLTPLLEAGLIAPAGAGGAPATVSATPQAATPTSPAQAASPSGLPDWASLSNASVSAIRSAMSRYVEQKLGPSAESICVRVEAAKTGEALRVEWGKIETMFNNLNRGTWLEELRAKIAAL
jgi:hypothetical protein